MRSYFFYSAIFLTIAIAIGSLISLNPDQAIPVRFSDKGVHIIGYCLLALNWMLAYKTKIKQLKSSVLISILVFLYGIIIESLQGVLTTNRQLDIHDIFANLVGILVAFVFFNIVFKKKQMN